MALPAAHRRSRPNGCGVTSPERTLATVAEAAESLGIGERTIRRWIAAERLKAHPAASGVKKKGSRVVVIQEVIALDRKLRQEARSAPRARLRRDHVAALRAMAGAAGASDLTTLPSGPNPDPNVVK